jgi:hypothetical protein
MKNFNRDLLECLVMIALSSGLIAVGWYGLILAEDATHRWVNGIVIGVNIPIFFYWIKKFFET